jgi:hypothetical protein
MSLPRGPVAQHGQRMASGGGGPPKRPREPPAAGSSVNRDAQSPFTSALSAVLDEKRVYIAGIPHDATPEQVTEWLVAHLAKTNPRYLGGMYTVMKVTFPPSKNDGSARRPKFGFAVFARPEGAAACIASSPMPVPGLPRPATLARPANYKPIDRPFNETFTFAGETDPGCLVFSGSNGAFRNLPPFITDHDMVRVLESVGPVERFTHERDSEKFSRGKLLVVYKTPAAATTALSTFNQNVIETSHGVRWRLKVVTAAEESEAAGRLIVKSMCTFFVEGSCRESSKSCKFAHDMKSILCLHYFRQEQDTLSTGERCSGSETCPYGHWRPNCPRWMTFLSVFDASPGMPHGWRRIAKVVDPCVVSELGSSDGVSRSMQLPPPEHLPIVWRNVLEDL